jgi:hypothetical protein
MDSPDRLIPVDCPACGAAAETAEAVASSNSAGLFLTCACGLRIVAGAILQRGADPDPDGVAGTWWEAPRHLSTPTYRAPGDRRHVLRLVPVSSVAGEAAFEPTAARPAPSAISSITIRFSRARRAPDATR